MGRYMTDIDVAVMMGEDRQQAIERILGIGWREAEFKMFTRVDEKEVNGKTALVGVGVIMLTPPPNVERDEELGIELLHGRMFYQANGHYSQGMNQIHAGMDLNWLLEMGAFDQNNYRKSLGLFDSRKV